MNFINFSGTLKFILDSKSISQSPTYIRITAH